LNPPFERLLTAFSPISTPLLLKSFAPRRSKREFWKATTDSAEGAK
jgi:hypothetical protein